MTHRNVFFARLLATLALSLGTLACLVGPPSAGNPQEGVRSLVGVAPTVAPPPNPGPENLPPVAVQDPGVTNPQLEPAPANADELHDYLLAKAEACDRMNFIDVSVGEARVVTFSDYCAQDCMQSVTFKNTHTTETIKLLFFMTASISPDQPGWTGQRWWQEVIGPGESVTKNQSNRTPHIDGCPWSATDYSLVGAIPTGNECRWVEDDPATSLLPLQEVENQCR